MTESLVGKIVDGKKVKSDEKVIWIEVDKSKKIIVVDNERNCLSARSAFDKCTSGLTNKYGNWSGVLSPIWYAKDYERFAALREELKGELSGVISGIYFPYAAHSSDSGAIACPIGLRVIAELNKSKIPFVLTGLDTENKSQDAFWLFQVINNLVGQDEDLLTYFTVRYAGIEAEGWRKTYRALIRRIELKELEATQ